MSFIRKTLTALICIFSVSSVGAENEHLGDFSDFYDGAIAVYIEKINPSIETSKRFHEHLLKMYFRSGCQDQRKCYDSGESAANLFVANLRMEKHKL